MATLQNNHNTQHGFTLIELLVTIGVIGVLAAIATPSMADIIRRGQLNREVRSVVEELQHARTNAVLLKRTTATNFGGIQFKYIQTPNNIEYDFMGRARFNNNAEEQCLSFVHKKDAGVTSAVRVRRVGNPDIFRYSDTCL